MSEQHPDLPETGPESRRLHREASRYLPGGTSRIHYYFSPNPIYARSGSGCRVTDVDGVERLDFLNNMTSLIHGHADPDLRAALSEQLERGTAWSEPGEEEIRLACLLVDRVDSLEKIRFANSGTEAVMFALKLAREFTGRSRIAKFEGFYHGYYDYVQVSFDSTPERWGRPEAPVSLPSSGGLSDPVVDQVVVAPFNDLEALERLLEVEGDSLAAFIVDPLAALAGMPLPQPGFYDALSDLCRRHGIVLIFDEVVSFRLGLQGGQGGYGGNPDLTVFGKIIGGGLPVGAVGGREEIMALLDPTRGKPRLLSGGTFSANPMSMTAGRVALEKLTAGEIERLNALGEHLRREGNRVLEESPEPAQLTGDGSLFRIVMHREPVTDYRSSVVGAGARQRLSSLHRLLLDEGVIVSDKGLACLSTPMGTEEVDSFVSALERAVARLGQLEVASAAPHVG